MAAAGHPPTLPGRRLPAHVLLPIDIRCLAVGDARVRHTTSAGSPPEAPPVERPAALVIGSGPVRIGQGVEFDYCAVQAGDALIDTRNNNNLLYLPLEKLVQGSAGLAASTPAAGAPHRRCA